MSPDRPEKEETVLLTAHPAALILEGIRRKYRPPRLRACLGSGRAALRLSRKGGLSPLLDQMDLTDDERRLLGLFDGIRSLDDVVARAGGDEAAALGVAWALRVLGLLAPAADVSPLKRYLIAGASLALWMSVALAGMWIPA